MRREKRVNTRRKFSGEVETFEYQKDVSILTTFINLSAFLKGVYGPIRKKWHCPFVDLFQATRKKVTKYLGQTLCDKE